MNPLELFNTIASVGTFVVIAVTAVAALVQLRHLKASNQLASLYHAVTVWGTPEFQMKIRWVRDELPARMKDERFVDELRLPGAAPTRDVHLELSVADLWEQTGSYIKNGLIDENACMDLIAAGVVDDWNRLVDVVRYRRMANGDSMYENFEYLAARAMEYRRLHPTNYPRGTPQLLPRR